MTHITPTPEMKACISECLDCHRSCLETIPHCLHQGGQHAEPAHIALLLTCADICQTAANAMLLGAATHKATCGACAEVCRQCAKDCERLAASDPAMKACADVCARCAASCEQMAR